MCTTFVLRVRVCLHAKNPIYEVSIKATPHQMWNKARNNKTHFPHLIIINNMSSACMAKLSSNFGSHVKYCTHEQRRSTNTAPTRQALLAHQPKYFHFGKCVLSFAAEAIYCLIKSLSRATLHCARNERPTAMRTKRFQFPFREWKAAKKWNWFSSSLIAQLNQLAAIVDGTISFDFVRQIFEALEWLTATMHVDRQSKK